MIVNPAGLNFQDAPNNTVPQEGPKAIPILLDFSGAVTEYDLDMTISREQNRISMVQTIYIDASLSTNGLTLICEGTNQRITVKGKTQGYYPIAVPNEPKLQFFGTASDAIIPIILFNTPIAGVQWATA